MAKDGLAEAEADKLRRCQRRCARGLWTVHSVYASLATNAALGLAPDQDAKDLESQRSATAKDLSALAAKYLDFRRATRGARGAEGARGESARGKRPSGPRVRRRRRKPGRGALQRRPLNPIMF